MLDQKEASITEDVSSPRAPAPVEVVALQNVALIDHVCKIENPDVLKTLNIHGELGGSHRVQLNEIQDILSELGDFSTKAGGAAANTMRALAGFGIGSRVVGCRGISDEWGTFFTSSLKRSNVDVSRMITKPGATGRCCILTCQGQRTMRTCMDNAARLSADDISVADFAGTKYVYLSAYCLYTEGLVDAAIKAAQLAECQIAMDLGSFEVIRSFRDQITAIIESKAISIIFCNEDEAIEIASGNTLQTTAMPEDGLHYLSKHCKIAVVTLGEKGALVKENGSDEIIGVPACSGVTVVDTTGAGDVFAAGFLFGILKGNSLRRAAEIGCLGGGAVVQVLGAEMLPANWQFLHRKMHGELAAETVRSSAIAVQQELLSCYSLIENKGRGVVYYGSARLREGSPYWDQTVRLGAAVSKLLHCTTWSGGGPGMMQAATLGAMSVNAPVAGIRIAREAGTTVRSASYLPADSQTVCRFLSSRKVALTDCGVRNKTEDKTAFIFLIGGLGTCDELFELLTLVQLKKLGTKYPVPIILCNFNGCYDGLLHYLASSVTLGTMGTVELKEMFVASDEDDVLNVLSDFYGLNYRGEKKTGKLLRASSWVEKTQNGDVC